MAAPKGTKFHDRHATRNGLVFFDCVRAGHGAGQKRVRRQFRSKSDYDRYVTRHDAAYHDEILARELGITRGTPLGDAVADFMQHIRDLVEQGKRDPKTLYYYQGITKKLIEHFGYHTPLETIGRRAALEYEKRRRAAGSSSRGARIIKELKVVRRLQAFMDIPVVWKMPLEDISPESSPPKDIPMEDIRDFLAAMPPGSLEHAFSMTKFLTMMRNEELYAANVGDVDLEARELSFWSRNKQTGAKHRQFVHIPGKLAPIIQALIAGRGADEPLFTLRGRRLTYTTLRKRFLRVSERATAARRKVDSQAPAVTISAIGSFRAEAATAAIDALAGVHDVQEQLGHKSDRTTRRHYKRAKKASEIASSKKVTGELEKIIN